MVIRLTRTAILKKVYASALLVEHCNSKITISFVQANVRNPSFQFSVHRKTAAQRQLKTALLLHSQIQDFVVEHVVRTECVLPASLQSTYKPSTSVGTLSENSMFPTTWWPLCGRNLIEIYHIVNFKVTPE